MVLIPRAVVAGFKELVAVAPLFINGRAVAPSVASDLPDAPLLFDGASFHPQPISADPPVCYEVVRVKSGMVLSFEPHMRRLISSIVSAYGATPEDAEKFVRESVAHSYHLTFEIDRTFNLNMKTSVWSVEGSFHYCTHVNKSFYPPQAAYDTGVMLAVLHGASRHNPNAKVMQPDVRGRAAVAMKQTGAFEVLLCGSNDVVPEGSRSNYFVVTPQGEMITSPRETVLPGITLDIVREICSECKIPFIEKEITLGMLLDPRFCQSLAMTGTSVGVLPVSELRYCSKNSETYDQVKIFTSACDVQLKLLSKLYDEAVVKHGYSPIV